MTNRKIHKMAVKAIKEIQSFPNGFRFLDEMEARDGKDLSRTYCGGFTHAKTKEHLFFIEYAYFTIVGSMNNAPNLTIRFEDNTGRSA